MTDEFTHGFEAILKTHCARRFKPEVMHRGDTVLMDIEPHLFQSATHQRLTVLTQHIDCSVELYDVMALVDDPRKMRNLVTPAAITITKTCPDITSSRYSLVCLCNWYKRRVVGRVRNRHRRDLVRHPFSTYSIHPVRQTEHKIGIGRLTASRELVLESRDATPVSKLAHGRAKRIRPIHAVLNNLPGIGHQLRSHREMERVLIGAAIGINESARYTDEVLSCR